MPADFAPIYAELEALMRRAASGMVVAKAAPGELVLHAPWPNPLKPKEPMWFGMVKQGRAYVSVHLMPLYNHAGLQAQVPPALAARKQGLTCFNFKKADPEAFAALETLTLACARAYAQPVDASSLRAPS